MLTPPAARLAQVRVALCARYGDLTITRPNESTGSVRIIADDADASWRLTPQGRLIAEPRSARRHRTSAPKEA